MLLREIQERSGIHMSRTRVWITQPGRQRRLLHTITGSSKYNSTETLSQLDFRGEQEKQAKILIEAWRRSGAKDANSLYEVDQSDWAPRGLRRSI